MPATVAPFMDEYIRRYSERDVEGVTELCLAPFLAIREGVPIYMPDHEAVRDHFAAMIDAYRGSGVATWKRIEIDVRELSKHAVFATVRWNALDADGESGTPARPTTCSPHPTAGVSSRTRITSRAAMATSTPEAIKVGDVAVRFLVGGSSRQDRSRPGTGSLP